MQMLADAIADIEAALAPFSKAMKQDLSSAGYEAWRKGRAEAEGAFLTAAAAAGAAVRDMSWSASFSLLGIRSTSTMGVYGAATNWLGRARIRLETEGGKPC